MTERRLQLARRFFPEVDDYRRRRLLTPAKMIDTTGREIPSPHDTSAALNEAAWRADTNQWKSRRNGSEIASEPISAADFAGETELETFDVEAAPDVILRASLVNTVNQTRLGGSLASVPWLSEVGRDYRQLIMSTVAVHRALLGRACPYSASHNRSFRLRYAAPFHANHGIFPLDMCVQETAATNDALGEFALQVRAAAGFSFFSFLLSFSYLLTQITMAMLRESLDLPLLAPIKRDCCNRVFKMTIASRRRQVDFDLLLHRFPQLASRSGDMQCLFMEHPTLAGMKMLAFRQPIILVGAARIDDLFRACRLFLPPIWQCTVPVPKPRLALLDQLAANALEAAGGGPEQQQKKGKKRERDPSTAAPRARGRGGARGRGRGGRGGGARGGANKRARIEGGNAPSTEATTTTPYYD